MHVAAIRITFSGLFLFLIALVKGLKYPRSLVDWGWMLLGALTGTLLYQICFNIGLITITSTTSSIIEAITPLTTAIMAAIILGEKLSPTGWLYSCTAFIGTAILILWDGALSMQIGVLWTIGAVLLFSAFNLISRRLSAHHYDALTVSMWTMLISGLLGSLLSPEAWITFIDMPMKAQGALLYLAAFSSGAGFLCWSYALEKAEKASDVVNSLFFMPVITAILAYLILGETLNLGFYIGGGIVIVSLILFSKYR